jgi:hypothetical protein
MALTLLKKNRPDILQSYPRRNGAGAIERRSFAVDLACASRTGGPRGLTEERLALEASEMALHFPRWILTISVGRERVLCRSCGGPLVFDRALRCAACEKKPSSSSLPREARLAWFGLLPPIGIDRLERLGPRLRERPPAQHVIGHRDEIGHYLLVPLVATYPDGFPALPARVAYLPGLFEVAGMAPDRPSHEVHLLGGGVMCLYAPGQWLPETTVRVVLQQRAYAHVIKLLNHGDGKHGAFAKVS